MNFRNFCKNSPESTRFRESLYNKVVAHGSRPWHTYQPINKKRSVKSVFAKAYCLGHSVQESQPSYQVCYRPYLRIFNDQDEFGKLISALDVWGDNAEHIAHPLMVLCAAESVESSEFEDMEEVIKGWNDGNQASDIIEYCVSKTLGSFSQSEIDVIQLLTLTSQDSTDITPEFIQTKLKEVENGTYSPAWLNGNIRQRLDGVGEDAYIDLRWKLIDRSFLQNSTGDLRTTWNHIAYKHLLDRFGGHQATVVEEEESGDIEFENVPTFGIDAISNWLQLGIASRQDWKPKRWTKTELIVPLDGVTNKLLRDLERRNDGESGKHPMEQILDTLEKQSVLMIRFFEQVENVILKRDPSLKSLIPSGQKHMNIFMNFSKFSLIMQRVGGSGSD